jgi:hypothetical protein
LPEGTKTKSGEKSKPITMWAIGLDVKKKKKRKKGNMKLKKPYANHHLGD